MTDRLTDAEKLAAIETYLKALKSLGEALRAAVTADMGTRHVERVGAYLPDGTKLAAVGYSDGRMSAKIDDEAAALKWCLENYPDEVETVQVVRPAFLKMLLAVAVDALAKDGDSGVDPRTGAALPFIKVTKGKPYVSVTTTKEGVQRMEALAGGFAGMLEAGQ